VPSRIDALVIDCKDPAVLAAFWCLALGSHVAETQDGYVVIEHPDGAGCPILFQVVPEARSVKNRLHLDLRPPSSMEAEVARLEQAGAKSLHLVDEGGSFWTVMADPEGNEFCVLRGPDDGSDEGANHP
jgi:hypothetical protein